MAAQRIELCIADASHWMAANMLKLNPDKTELLWAGSKYGPAPLSSRGPSLQLGRRPSQLVITCLLGVLAASEPYSMLLQ